MASYNKVMLMGNLTRDPELSYTPQGTPICKLGLAVNRSFTTATGEKKEDALFVDIDVWKKQAEACATYLKKGSSVFIDGELRLDRWQSKEGEKRSKIKVVANRVQFIGGGAPKTGGKVAEDMPVEEHHQDPAAEEAAGATDEEVLF